MLSEAKSICELANHMLPKLVPVKPVTATGVVATVVLSALPT